MNTIKPAHKFRRPVPMILLVTVGLIVGAYHGRVVWNEFYFHFLNWHCFLPTPPNDNPEKFVTWWTSHGFDNEPESFAQNRIEAAKYLSPEAEKTIRRVFWSNKSEALPIDIIVPQSAYAFQKSQPNSIDVARVIVDLSKPEMPHLYVRMVFGLEQTNGKYKITKIKFNDGSEQKIDRFIQKIATSPDRNIVAKNLQATKQFRRGPIWGDGLKGIAVEELKKSLQYNKNFALACIELGRAEKSFGNDRKCIEYFERAVDCDPCFVLSYLHLGAAHESLGEYDKALDIYTEATEIDSESYAAFTEKGIADFRAKDYRKALADFSRLIELEPDNAYGYLGTGLSYKQLEHYQNAFDDLTKGIELCPNNGDLYDSRSDVSSSLGNWKSALDDSNKAIEINPNNSGYYCVRSRAYFKANQFDLSIKDANIAIVLAPKSENGYKRRAYAKWGRNDLKGAIDDFTIAIKLKPNDPDIVVARNQVQFFLNYEKRANAVVPKDIKSSEHRHFQ